MKYLRLLMLVISVAAPAGAQDKQVDKDSQSASFRKALAGVKVNAGAWRLLLARVKIEDLPVTYAVGKAMVQSMDLANKDIGLVIDDADQELRHPSLSGEIVLMSQIQSLQSDLQSVGSLVLAFDMPTLSDAKKVSDWALDLEKLADGPVQSLWGEAYTFVVVQAAGAEVRCSNQVP
jgi:hypothetical protein